MRPMGAPATGYPNMPFKPGPTPTHSATMGKPERAIKWLFDLKTRMWSQEEITVRIDSVPFGRGSMRSCYHMLDMSKPEGQQAAVAKLSNDGNDSANVYRQDVEMQKQCEQFAVLFNRTKPPKDVHFLDAHLLECVSRPDRRIYFIEPLLRGKYCKYSNNFGFVYGGRDARNTPQAFSHFTYHVSGGLMLVCDIQGVGDSWTDPQIHTIDAVIGRRDNRFGKGNVGIKGIQKFFETHRCNDLCEYLELPPLGQLPSMPKNHGTVLKKDHPFKLRPAAAVQAQQAQLAAAAGSSGHHQSEQEYGYA